MEFKDMYKDELKKKQQFTPVAGANIKPTSFGYDAINQDIGNLRNLNMNAPKVNYDYNQGIHQNFNLGDMQGAIDRLNTPQQQQYQNPEQMRQMMNTWLAAMQPYLDSQQQVGQSQFNRQQQALQNEWARRGLLGTTAAGMAEQDAAGNFALQSQNMQNAAMMDALGKSFDFAQLGLAERDLSLQQDQAGMNAWLNALGLQEQMNQNIRDTNRAMSQDEFNNWADAMGLTLQQKQAVISSMLSGAGLESENQQRSFANNLANAQMAQQADQNFMDNLYRGLTSRENERQFNFNNALNWSQLFGQYVDPVQSGNAMRNQLQGRDTMARQAQDATFTGQYQGQMTPQQAQIMAALSGINPYTGDQTLDARQFQQQLAQQWNIANLNARSAGGLNPMQQLQYDMMMNDPAYKYGEGYSNFLGGLYQNPPTTQEEYDNYTKQLNTLVAGGMLTGAGAQAAREALKTNRIPEKQPSWISSIFSNLGSGGSASKPYDPRKNYNDKFMDYYKAGTWR